MAEIVPYRPNPHVTQQREAQDSSGARPESYPEHPANAMGLLEYVAIVRRQRWVVLGVLLLAAGATVYNVMKTPARYRAASTVRLADPGRTVAGSMASPYEGTFGNETDRLQSQIQVLTSRTVAAKAVDMSGLRLMPIAGHPFVEEVTDIRVADNAPPDSIRVTFGPTSVTASSIRNHVTAPYGQSLEIQGISFKVTQRPAVASTAFTVVPKDVAISNVRHGFQAYARPQTDIIDLVYTGNEPNQVRRVSNAMALAFQAHDASVSQQQSRRRRIFLEGQLRQTDSMLRGAAGAYSSYRSREQVFSSKGKATAQEMRLVEIDMKRSELDAERRTYQSLLSQAQKSGQASDSNLRVLVSSPGIAANPVIQKLYGQLTSYEEVRDSLETAGAAPTNPDVIAVNSRIAATSSRLISAVRSQIQSLDAQIAAMDNLRSASSSQIAAAPAAEAQEGHLEQQVLSVQKMADALQSELQLAKIAEAVEVGQVEIVDPAPLPGSPIASGNSRKIALGIFIGLLLGNALAVVVDGLNTSIKRHTDIERVLGIPGLAVIPRLLQVRNGNRRIARVLPRLSGIGKISGANGADGMTIADVRSSSAEAYRTLRTNLIFSQSVQALRTIVVTSGSPGEGKTTTAANLAVSFAQHGMRVLLVDCDLRRGRLHKIFNIKREPGITELALGREEPDAVTRETDVTGLYVVPSGVLPPNPSELLGGQRMRKSLAALSEAFDLIILDTPPLLAASDGAILATLCDGVVLVLRAGATQGDAAQQAIRQLAAVGARVVGAVLNDPDAKVPTYSGYYNYEYEYTAAEG
jgi:capsular exopolysaccharide synthesis family protein